MSWFTDLAGRAENILNKIDQNAATVLQQQHSASTISSHNDILIDIKNETPTVSTPMKRGMPLSSKKLLLRMDPVDTVNDERFDNDNTITDDKRSVHSMSRRSSSSRAADEGTVIEVPQMTVSSTLLSSMKGAVGFEQELAAMKIVFSEVQSERDDLKGELESALTHLKVIDELNAKCERLVMEKELIAEKVDSLERSNSNYIKSISDLELKLSKSQVSESDLTNKLDWAKRETEETKKELQQYRSRAQSTLQIKDKIIEQLKEKDTEDGSVSVTRINSIEVENLKMEKKNLLEEIRVQSEQLEQIRAYVEKLENVQRDQEREFDRRVNTLNGNLRLEETKWMQFENDSKAQMKELASVKDEMKLLQIEYSNKIREK